MDFTDFGRFSPEHLEVVSFSALWMNIKEEEGRRRGCLAVPAGCSRLLGDWFAIDRYKAKWILYIWLNVDYLLIYS